MTSTSQSTNRPADLRTTDLSAEFDGLDAESVLRRAVATFPKLGMACSFQQEEAVLLAMIREIGADISVFTLDTHVLFDETRATWAEFEKFYGITIKAHDVLPDPRFVAAGEAAWTKERCCTGAKVETVRRAVVGFDAWITGVRRDQAPTRAGTRKCEWDDRNGLWKVSPIAAWTSGDVQAYIDTNGLPNNPLHAAGYASIGCAPCTLPGPGRDGRWAGTEKTECGLHADG